MVDELIFKEIKIYGKIKDVHFATADGEEDSLSPINIKTDDNRFQPMMKNINSKRGRKGLKGSQSMLHYKRNLMTAQNKSIPDFTNLRVNLFDFTRL